MSQPAKYDIKLTAGDDFQVTLRLLEEGDPIDTQGYTFAAQARSGYLPDTPLIVNFTVVPVTGGATIKLTSEQTRQLGQASRVFWDFQSSSPNVRTWVTGRVFVAQEVTQ